MDLPGKLIRNHNLIDIDDGIAMGADKMRMGSGVEIETLHSVYHADRGDHTLALKRGKVAIDRAERKIGDRRLELGIDPVGGGVFFRGANALQDRVAFLTVFADDHQQHSFRKLQNNNDYYF